MKKDDVIVIYCDSITKKEIEGRVRLIKLVDECIGLWNGLKLQRWKVRFLSDQRNVERNILEEEGG